MCLGGRRQPPQIATQESESEFQNRPVTVTGKQTGVDNPKDTAKATETLKIKRQKEEGTYVDPNLTTADILTRRRSGNNRFKNNLRNRRKSGTTKAQKMARARLGKKFSSSPTGRRTGVA